jgi:hypothetical protein
VDRLRESDFPEIELACRGLIEAATDILQLALGLDEYIMAYIKWQAFNVS